MKLTKKSEYAIRCLIDISIHENDALISVDEISVRQEISLKFLGTILTDLKKAGLVKSRKGPKGGYRIAQSLNQISLQDIIKSIDGMELQEIYYNEIHRDEAATTQQVVKDSLDEVNEVIQKEMSKITLLELKTRYLKIMEGEDTYSI